MVIYKLKLRCHSFSACLLLTLGRFLFNVFYICLALDSSNWIKICLDSSSRILELHSLMSFWLFCRWLWTSLCPVCQVCHMIIFCSFGIFEFLLRSTLFCFSFEYCRFSYLAMRNLVKPKKSQKHSQSFVWKLISKPGSILVVFFFEQIKINSLYTYRRHHLPGQRYFVVITWWKLICN